jgi:hypothetical protein
MELATAERIVWGAWSFIMLILYLRWCGPPEDQKEVSPPPCPVEEENAEADGQSLDPQ